MRFTLKYVCLINVSRNTFSTDCYVYLLIYFIIRSILFFIKTCMWFFVCCGTAILFAVSILVFICSYFFYHRPWWLSFYVRHWPVRWKLFTRIGIKGQSILFYLCALFSACNFAYSLFYFANLIRLMYALNSLSKWSIFAQLDFDGLL